MKEFSKLKKAIIIFLGLIFLIPFSLGIYKLFPQDSYISGGGDSPITYDVTLTNDYNGGLILSNNKAVSNRAYTTNITINQSILPGKILPNALNENDVLCNDEVVTFTYEVGKNNLSAQINIPATSVKGNITINISLIAPTDFFKVTLKANGGRFEGDLVEKVFDVSPGQTLNDLVEYSRPTNFREGYHFTHWELENKREVKLYEDTIIPYAPEGATYLANCELNEIKMHIYPNGGAFPNMQVDEVLDLNTLYDTTINEIAGYPGDPTKDNHKFLYYIDTAGNHFLPTDTVTIPDNMDDNFILRATYAENLSITLEPNGGTFPIGTPTTFDTYRGITLAELEDYLEPTPPTTSQEFAYWIIQGDVSSTPYYKNTMIDKSGTITLLAQYVECPHPSISTYTVTNNKLYGICSECGTQILVPNNKLGDFSNQFLFFNGSEYELYSIDDLPSLVSSATTHDTLDIYLINGAYDLEASRETLESLVTINVHGLLNNEGELNATVNCTNLMPDYPRFYLYVDLVFDNLIMKGEDVSGMLYEVGLKANNIEYNHCYLTGMQSLHSEQVIFNDCYFDATTHQGSPEYSIYSYATRKVEFNRCDFLSNGKAVKIYSEGAAPNAVFKFTDCDFMVEASIATKAAIEVDSTYQPNSPYNVYITRCTQEGYIGGLYHDSANPSHTNFIVTD